MSLINSYALWNNKGGVGKSTILNITVQMYPCSEGTDTGNPVL